MTELTPAQLDVAAAFFALPESKGFVLVGGAALIALELVQRATEDLDFFTDDATTIGLVADAFHTAATRANWTIVNLRQTPTFQRLEVTIGNESVRLDIAVDSPNQLPPVASPIGPTLAPLELAARKLLALFDRAQPRDFLDVYRLSQRYDRDAILTLACDLDRGLDHEHLAVSFGILDRIPSDHLPCDPSDVPALRDYFANWKQTLQQ